MKKLLLFGLILISSLFLSTVNVNSQSTVTLKSGDTFSYFNSAEGFQKAYEEAKDGDVIILPGGTFDPPEKIAKQIKIFGAGHYPDGTTATGRSVIAGDIVLDSGADYFYLEGVAINGDFSVVTDVSVNNITLNRNHISGIVNFPLSQMTNYCEQIVIRESIILEGVVLRNARSVLLTNSILGGRITSYNYNIDYSYGNVISNNIIINRGGYSYLIGNCDNNRFSYNILYTRNSPNYFQRACSNNTFEYNIFDCSASAFGNYDSVYENWMSVSTDLLFANFDDTVFNYDNDYSLLNPDLYKVLVDQELGIYNEPGIYGGAFPFKANAVPSLPYIVSSRISFETGSAGKLDIDIEVEAQEK
ncbi:hypothetical protein QA597_07890 [Marinilabiliaceae bacterium ANBcel2]|nr:hypothetical protein [Marinilabiliaceae bacterium ANBcel2]